MNYKRNLEQGKKYKVILNRFLISESKTLKKHGLCILPIILDFHLFILFEILWANMDKMIIVLVRSLCYSFKFVEFMVWERRYEIYIIDFFFSIFEKSKKEKHNIKNNNHLRFTLWMDELCKQTVIYTAFFSLFSYI